MKQTNLTTKKFFYSIKTTLCCLLLLASTYSWSQDFTWMHGSNQASQPGVYGALGVPSVNNDPGARETLVSWKDASGNLWLFGGLGYDGSSNYGFLNDLWKYNPITNEWTWIHGNNVADDFGVYGTQGVPSSLNVPGARSGAISWTDASGNLWLFGGQGWDSGGNLGSLNDLWKYNPTTNQWTWMKGSNTSDPTGVYGNVGVPAANNNPGGRNFSASWADGSGNLWLFGGVGFDGSGNYGDMGDLWRYNITSGQWAWIKGPVSPDQNGVYGTIGVPATANLPGCRYLSNCWNDGAGNLWLGGGAGFDGSSGFEDYMNDLWKYNITSNQWTWVKGSSVSGQQGTYGTQGTAAPSNVPGSRIGSFSWTDAAGNLFLFGGMGYDGSSVLDFLNDLWLYNITSNQWTWLKGSNSTSQIGTYGTQGVPATGNVAGSRVAGCSWTDNSNNLWLFGGFGYDNGSSMAPDDINDLWKISTCFTNPVVTITTTSVSLCLGNSATLTASGATTYVWSNNQTGAVIVVSPTLTGMTSYTTVGSDLSGCSGTATIALNVTPLPVVVASSVKPIICKGEQVTLNASGASAYAWNTVPASSGPSIIVSPTITTNYVVSGTDQNGCVKTFTISQIVNPCTGIDAGTTASRQHAVYPNPNNGVFTISGPALEEGNKIVIFNTLGQKVFEDNLNAGQNNVHTGLTKGVYYYNILLNEHKSGSGKIIVD
ncbi:MAG: kelch repeat-containing protein [Bacteroidota bacterium]